MRIIPRNTKVATEFFTGVSLSDIVVGAVGVLLLFFVVVSNLPYKLGICGVIAAIFVLLLVRIDTEANYMFLLRIVKHFSYHRKYRRLNKSPFAEMEEAINKPVKKTTKKKHATKKKKVTGKKNYEGASQA